VGPCRRPYGLRVSNTEEPTVGRSQRVTSREQGRCVPP
jgi:hypothetical protein